MVNITLSQLKKIGFIEMTNQSVTELNKVLGHFNITSKRRIRHFLAQACIESWYGKELIEQNYTDQYDTGTTGGNIVGNTKPGDGKHFMGAGYLQITGRYNYNLFSQYEDNSKIMSGGAKYVASKLPWESAGYIWHQRRGNQAADKGNVSTVTDTINPGDKNINTKTDVYNKALKYI